MNMFEAVVTVWFMSAVIIHIAGTIALGFWLDGRGVKLNFFWRGAPGYLERVYREWCVSQGRSYRTIFVIRLISLINAILACVFFVLINNKVSGNN